MTPAFRRQRALADYTLAALARRRGKNIGLVVIYALVVFVVASALLFSSALRHEADTVLAEAPELIVQNLAMGRHDMIKGDVIDDLAAIRGVTRVEGRLWGYFYDSVNGANYTLMVPLDPDRVLAPGEAMIGEGVPRVRGMFWETAPLFLSRYSGDLVRFDVVERISSESALVSTDLILLNEADFRDFFGLPGGVYTDIAVTVRNSREIETIMSKASALLPEARFITRDDISRTYQKLFSWREGIMVALAAAALLAFAIFAAEKASGLSAEEAREIGILKAVGWNMTDVIAMKLWEGALISAGAFLIGTLAGYLHVFTFQAGLFAPILKGWSVIYPDFALTPRFDGVQIAALFLITVLPYTAATLVPVWRVAAADPDQVMR
ncbi:ABC transporter permease [Maritimibacter sp. HL-12]|uniref:ABC transporter permease n=1 Tax=Maritimibacter sp. HL-12 TaxID=1162418 RepID=UPI000A0F343B|nr:ABC transporter permease [Maritimibacter sp. HL-12]SMH33809.1 ABC-type transport system, involved in lipoprotein release, permease component [Maritimibacter sp. HL-12]